MGERLEVVVRMTFAIKNKIMAKIQNRWIFFLCLSTNPLYPELVCCSLLSYSLPVPYPLKYQFFSINHDGD